MLTGSQKPSSTLLLPRGVRRALDAMRANVSRDWSVVDLAAAAGVSSRTLQRQFKMFLGKTPGTALRDLRFDCARRELLQSSPDVKVMDLALRCGFAHCGRFSIEYRRRYGETPSQTLKRQAVFTGVLATMPSIFVSSRDRPDPRPGADRIEPGEWRDRPPGCRRARHRADAGRRYRRQAAESGALSPDRRACADGAGRRG